MLVVAKRATVRCQGNEMPHVCVTVPQQELYGCFKELKVPSRVELATSLRSDRSPDPVTAATKSSPSSLARRIKSQRLSSLLDERR